MCAHVWVDQEAVIGVKLELRLMVTYEVHLQKSTFSSKVLPPEKSYNLSKYLILVGNTKFGVHTEILSSLESESDFIVKTLNLALT